jgi:histidinol-phosphate aminotransferase
MLRERIAARHQLGAERIVVGSSPSEIFRRAIEAFTAPDRAVMGALETAEIVGLRAERPEVACVTVPLTRNYEHDLRGMLGRSTESTGLVYICNPNNPTGTITRRQEIEAFLRRLPATTYLVVDETYCEYVGRSADYRSFVDDPVDDPRLIVVKSISNPYAIQGAGVGYAVAASVAAERLISGGAPSEIASQKVHGALAALADPEHLRLRVQRNDDERQEFFNQANARMLRVIDSQTNFVMLNTGMPARGMVSHFKRHGIRVAGPYPTFDTHVRVSIGTRAQMRDFWHAWDALPKQGHMAM